jgi:hypothetical protein
MAALLHGPAGSLQDAYDPQTGIAICQGSLSSRNTFGEVLRLNPQRLGDIELRAVHVTRTVTNQ